MRWEPVKSIPYKVEQTHWEIVAGIIDNLNEIIALQNQLSVESNEAEIGKIRQVLVEGTSKRSDEQLCGRTSQNKMVVFDRGDYKAGDYVTVKITGCSSATLFGTEVLE